MEKKKNNKKVSPASETQAPEKLSNHELVVIAAYLVGAELNSADTEDIAVKANQLAPGRFSWRKYKDQINIDTVRKRLWDATNAEKGAYLIGTEKTGWRLTKAGYDFALRAAPLIDTAPSTEPRRSQNERANATREIKRLLAEDAYRKFENGLLTEITKVDAERFFRIDDYVIGDSRAAKIERFRILAEGHKSLSTAINHMATLIGGK